MPIVDTKIPGESTQPYAVCGEYGEYTHSDSLERNIVEPYRYLHMEYL